MSRYYQEWLNFYHSLWQSDRAGLLEFHKISPNDLNIDFVMDRIERAQLVQDISANASANIESRWVAREKYEAVQSFFKYLTFRRLFEKTCELYGIEEGRRLLMYLLEGKLYLHDATGYIIPYCLGVDFSKLFTDGMPDAKLVSLPPKKPKSFINQVKEAVIELSNEFAGAIAFPTLLLSYTYIYLDYYGKDVVIDRKEVRDDFQNLVHTINKEMRNGVESPFTNLSFFDRYILDELITYVYPHFLEKLGMEKEAFIERVMEIQEIVMEFLAEGDPVTKGPYPFPVLTANFLLDKDRNIKDGEFLKLVSRYNCKGIMNIYCSQDARKYSMCCRFQPDYKNVKFDSFGNGGVNVGSIKVVTVNLNRIALEVINSNEDGFTIGNVFERLSEYMDAARRILDVYRELLRETIKSGKLKYFARKWFDLDKHFYSTVGFIGLWEMYHTLSQENEFATMEYLDFAKEILSYMDYVIKKWNSEGLMWKYNLEQVPGENLASFLPKIDRYFFGTKKVPYTLYANQFIPLYVNVSIFDKINIEGKLFPYLSGGGISHINIGEELPEDVIASMIQTIAKAGIEHFALNPVFSICEKGHYTYGKVKKCAYCGEKIKDHMTRIVGFFTKVSKWNKERREWEFPKRLWYGKNETENIRNE